MGPIEDVIKLVMLWCHKGVDCHVRVRKVLCKLPSNPFQSALPDMILGSKDSIVPVTEVGILLV